MMVDGSGVSVLLVLVLLVAQLWAIIILTWIVCRRRVIGVKNNIISGRRQLARVQSQIKISVYIVNLSVSLCTVVYVSAITD